MDLRIVSKSDLTRSVAELAVSGPLDVAVGEDECLGRDKWISVGTVKLFPAGDQPAGAAELAKAAHVGAFTWLVPDEEALQKGVECTVDCDKDTDRDRLLKGLGEAIQDVLRRTGLLTPVFDARTLGRLPPRSPITIVPDTSAVHQGALDFACRFLAPWIRVKVPAVVYMEIAEQVDSYLGARHRSELPKHRGAGLRQHTLGCGGQAALLRLELRSQVEIDRGDLGADPLRGVITPSSDPEDKALGLTRVVRSFGDRLIVETARRFQTQVRRDHPLAVLTSDQGMARMCMAEGLDVWFFQARAFPRWAGQLLSGATFHPFDSAVSTVALADVLWEFAETFGGVRVLSKQTDKSVELWALGGAIGIPWQPVHAIEDLMPGVLPDAAEQVPARPSGPAGENTVRKAPAANQGRVGGPAAKQYAQELKPAEHEEVAPSYAFAPKKLLLLIEALAGSEVPLERQDVPALLGIETTDQASRYINFLLAGGLIAEERGRISRAERTLALWSALVAVDLLRLLELLRRIPSFDHLWKYIHSRGATLPDDTHMPVSKKARATYLRLGEAAGAWASISGHGIVATPSQPELQEFRRAAMDAYAQIAGSAGTDLVLTGEWLEALARNHRIHPVVARRALIQARDAGVLGVQFEGSTPDTRFDSHRIFVLESDGAKPSFHTVFLYQGSFISSGTSSVRLRIQEPGNAS